MTSYGKWLAGAAALALGLGAQAAAAKSTIIHADHVVTDPGSPVRGQSTVIVTDGAHTWQTASSSPDAALPDGGYLFPALDPGTYSVTVSASGYGQQTAQVTLTSGTVRRDLVLQAGE